MLVDRVICLWQIGNHAINGVENIAPVTRAPLKVYDSTGSPLHHYSKELCMAGNSSNQFCD